MRQPAFLKRHIVSMPLVLACIMMAACIESAPPSINSRPPARTGPMAGSARGLIYVTGGAALEQTAEPRFDAWNPSTNSWTTLPAPPHQRSLGAMVAVGPRLYLIGGLDGDNNPIGLVDVFNLETNNWEHSIEDPHPASRLAAVSFDSSFAVIGGVEDGEVHSNRVRIYDTRTSTWQDRAPLLRGRHGHAAARIGSRIYVTGGYASSGETSEQVTSVEISDDTQSQWSPGPSLRAPHGFHGMAEVNGRLFVFGTRGENRSTEILNAESNAWVTGPDMPSLRHRFGCAVVGAKVYVIDGEGEQGEPQASIMVLDAVANTWGLVKSTDT